MPESRYTDIRQHYFSLDKLSLSHKFCFPWQEELTAMFLWVRFFDLCTYQNCGMLLQTVCVFITGANKIILASLNHMESQYKDMIRLGFLSDDMNDANCVARIVRICHILLFGLFACLRKLKNLNFCECEAQTGWVTCVNEARKLKIFRHESGWAW